MIVRPLALIALTLASVPAGAQQQAPQPRVLPVSADAPFVHKNSGITLPATIGGLPRTQVREFEGPELDIVGNWVRADDSAELSVYVYRSTVGSVPVWFDRAAWAIQNRGLYGTPAPVQAPAAIRAPGATADSGLIATWTASSGAYKGTGVAIVPVGEWLVKLRYSSKTEDGAAVAAVLRAGVAAIGWPAKMPEGVAAVPIADCAAPIQFTGKAKTAKSDASSAIAGAFGGLVVSSGIGKQTGTWCRDSSPLANTGLYRVDGATDGYLLALSDAGRGILVGQSGLNALFDPKAKPSWSIDLITPKGSATYPPQDRLPSPQRVAELLQGAPVSTATTWGNKREINLSADQLK